jgi:hypothetical protein
MQTAAAQQTVLRLRRDYIPQAASMTEMQLGVTPLATDIIGQAADLFERGARHVEIDRTVDFTATGPGADVAAALILIRELTAHGIVVAWHARLPEGINLPLMLGHLYPPGRITGVSSGAEIAELWRRRFYLGKFFWRRGPGFAEIRDRRMQRTARLVIDDPEHLRWLDVLSRGTAKTAVPGAVLADFAAKHLVHQAGDIVWLTPYRIRRWPSHPMAL